MNDKGLKRQGSLWLVAAGAALAAAIALPNLWSQTTCTQTTRVFAENFNTLDFKDAATSSVDGWTVAAKGPITLPVLGSNFAVANAGSMGGHIFVSAAGDFTGDGYPDLIGLEIGGGEPTEIAVSIAAELISVRSGRKTQTFDESVRDAIRATDEPRVRATIIAHQGSAPRGTGSRLLVGPNGYVAGTVGGGKVEMAAMTTAKAMLSGEDPSDVECLNFTLSDVGAYALGMTCGGRVRLMLERI